MRKTVLLGKFLLQKFSVLQDSFILHDKFPPNIKESKHSLGVFRKAVMNFMTLLFNPGF